MKTKTALKKNRSAIPKNGNDCIMTPDSLAQVIADMQSPECSLPPPGWKCTRKAGHDGPCAAVPTRPCGTVPIMLSDEPWIGVDLDATLAHYDDWRGIDHIGPPIEAMQTRVKQWLSEGKHVRILTARVGPQRHDVPHTIEEITHHIEQWCLQHLGQVLPVTYSKDYNMVAFYDDRCMQVIPNDGTCVVDDFNQRLIDRTTGFMQTLGQQALEIANLKRERDDARKEAKTNAILALYEHGHITEGHARQLTKCSDLVFFRMLREQAFKEMCSLLELPETPAPLPQP